MRRLVLAICAATAVAGLLSACSQEEAAPKKETIRPVRALKIADVSNFEQRWFSGRARAVQEIDLSFRISGPLIFRGVNVGDTVEEGAVVAQVDPATFRADVAQAEAGLARAEAALSNTTDQLNKQRQLVTRGLYSVSRLDEYIAAEQQAKAEVSAQRASLERRKLDLSYTTLRAPFAGIVVQTFVENFQDVQAKEPVLRLVDNSKIEMTINLPETLISQVGLIDKGIVVFDAYPGVRVPATLKEIGTEASATTRTYPITISMDQPEGIKILPGMAGKATADPRGVEGIETTIFVPESAVLSPSSDAAPQVWVFDPSTNKVARRDITTRGLADQGIIVASGLEPGEFIVTAGVHYLRDGQEVRLLQEAR